VTASRRIDIEQDCGQSSKRIQEPGASFCQRIRTSRSIQIDAVVTYRNSLSASQRYCRRRCCHNQPTPAMPKRKKKVAIPSRGTFCIARWTTLPGALLPSEEVFWREVKVPGNTTNPASNIHSEAAASMLNFSGVWYDSSMRSLCLLLCIDLSDAAV
jgi:hypothetical protein